MRKIRISVLLIAAAAVLSFIAKPSYDHAYVCENIFFGNLNFESFYTSVAEDEASGYQAGISPVDTAWEYQAGISKKPVMELSRKNILIISFFALTAAAAVGWGVHRIVRSKKYSKRMRTLLGYQKDMNIFLFDLRAGKFVSKGIFPVLSDRRFEKDDKLIEQISEILKEDFEGIKKKNSDFQSDDIQLRSEKTGENIYMRRYSFKVSRNKIMTVFFDVTAEKVQEHCLNQAAYTDYLSNMMTRRAIEDLLRAISMRQKENNKRLFVMMLDIDDFKSINDRFGSFTGDRVLVALAKILTENLGAANTARWGGEEFLGYTWADDEQQAYELAEKIIDIFRNTEFDFGDREIFRCSVSCGVAQVCGCNGYDNAIICAYKALNEAKQNGKNRICVYKCTSEQADTYTALSENEISQRNMMIKLRRESAKRYTWTAVFTGEREYKVEIDSDLQSLLKCGSPNDCPYDLNRLFFGDRKQFVDTVIYDYIDGRINTLEFELMLCDMQGKEHLLYNSGMFISEDKACIHFIAFDITDINEFYCEQDRLIEQLKHRVMETDLAIETANAFFWRQSINCDLFILGDSAKAVLGYPIDYFEQKFSRFEALIVPPYGEICLRAKIDYLNGLTDIYACEYPIKSAAGAIKWIRSRGRLSTLRKDEMYGIIVDITDIKENEFKLAKLAYRDSLTGTYNVQYLSGREIYISSTPVHNYGAVLVDIKGFKRINEMIGHVHGDELLIYFAKMLAEAVPEARLIRIPADRFLLIFENCECDRLIELAVSLIDMFSKPVSFGHRTVIASVNIGIAISENHDMIELLKDAELALGCSKKNSSCDYCFLTEELRNIDKMHNNLEFDLKLAIDRDEFELYYQPKVSVSSGRVVAVEALIRWKHPTLGVVMPVDFINLAEETNIIVPIGDIVLRDAIRQGAIWQSHGLNLIVSVNLSVKQLYAPGLVDHILCLLKEYGLSPELLSLEITESVMVGDFAQVRRDLLELQEHGIRVELDDFGQGYSTMNYLTRMPIDFLKIDSSYVRNAHLIEADRIILESLINMGHRLGLKVIAEGVEIKEQLDVIRDLGCDLYQGFYFSKPLSAEEFSSLIKAHEIERQ